MRRVLNAVLAALALVLPQTVHAKPIPTEWISPNRAGQNRGPVYIPQGAIVREVQVKEQAGFGVVDMRLGFQSAGQVGVFYTGWVCNNPVNVNPKTLVVPASRMLAGIDGKEQAGFGIIDIRLYFRDSKGNVVNDALSGWACGSRAEAKHYDGRIPPGNAVVGLEAREQAGFGVVNFRLQYQR